MTGLGGCARQIAVFRKVNGQRDKKERPMDRHGCMEDAPHHAATPVLAGRDVMAGQGIRALFAASLRWASREAGMPIRRQLWTVEVGAWISFATALVPPNPSMMRSASVSIP